MFEGHSVLTETNTKEDGTIVITPCKTKKDCFRNMKNIPCGPSEVTCNNGYCVCGYSNFFIFHN